MSNIDNLSVNAIRMLAADSIQKAKSGHPGLPLGAAPMAYELWAKHMTHNPKNPQWMNRDRFILSAGHGSALLYSLLHLFGYGNLSMDDMKQFRQLGSKTPGHPEYGMTVGVEATTGPLGAGLGTAVGMAIAEAHMAAVFNKEGFPVFDHYTYVLCGDGCLMEGISSEAFSLAGTLGLGKLIVLYDSNNITIEGDTESSFTENVCMRMEAFGFQTLRVEDGNDLTAIGEAIETARAEKSKPSFIEIKTRIGYGCPAKEGLANAHGEPLGEDNVRALKENLGWPDKSFYVPDEVYKNCKELSKNGEEAEEKWNGMFAEYCVQFPEMKELLDQYFNEEIAKELINDESYWITEDKATATRNTSGDAINRIKKIVPGLMGGSADLGPSNKSIMKDTGFISKHDFTGCNIHFGVREQAMAAIANGIALHGGLRTFAATFFVFSDYMKPMIRLSALMGLPVTFILTHDSIGVGEDGPTHEPVEQLAMLRSMQNLNVFRPADSTETLAAWYSAITSKSTPTAIVCSRQNLPQLAGTSREALKGGYVVSDSSKEMPDAIIIATGSEVSLAVRAKEVLAEEGVDVRVVSMPCMEIFEKQSEEYREAVLPKTCRARVVVEALSEWGWGSYVGIDGTTVCMSGYGASAPADVLFEKFGFTTDNVVAAVKSVL